MDEKIICPRCTNETDEPLVMVGGQSVCETCRDAIAVVCCECEDYVLTHYSYTYDGSSYCDSCYGDNFNSCDNCCESFPNDDVHYYNGRDLCAGCYSEYYFTCEECEEVYHNDYYRHGQCTDCASNSDVVKRHDYDVCSDLPTDKGFRLFGCELEVATEEYMSEVAEHTHELVKEDAILKHDGSIDTGDYAGFEIVTRPMTLANQFVFWDKFLDKCDKSLRSYDVGTCGLHIHVTRKSVSQLTIGKLLVFLNNPEHKSLLLRVAQRYSCDYSQAKMAKMTDAKYRNSARYEFLNLQNDRTIEFRIFRGTLNRQRFMACLEFTSSLITFCEKTSIQNITAVAFREFLGREPKNKNLKALLGIIPAKAEVEPMENKVCV